MHFTVSVFSFERGVGELDLEWVATPSAGSPLPFNGKGVLLLSRCLASTASSTKEGQ